MSNVGALTGARQPDLFEAVPTPRPLPTGGRRRRRSIEEQFEAFHALNPWVYERLVKMTRELAARGRRRIGVGMLFEVLRWQYQMGTVDPFSDFKLNNSYRAGYARLIMRSEPDLDGIFETRRSQLDDGY